MTHAFRYTNAQNKIFSVPYVNRSGEAISDISTLDIPQSAWVVILSSNLIRQLPFGAFSEQASNILQLDLSSNLIDSISDNAFSYTKQLKYLNLFGNKLTQISAHMFKGLDSLEQLWIGKNEIEMIDKGSFSNLKQLKRLKLDGNRIQILSENIFESGHYVDGFLQVHLQGNPVQCDCNMEWIQQADWLVLTHQASTICSGPPLYANKAWADVYDKELTCISGLQK